MNGNFVIADEVAEVTATVARRFMGQSDGKGVGLIGQNGVGKSLLFKVMGAIAPYFNSAFSWHNAEALTFDMALSIHKKSVYIDELGKEGIINNYGTKEDPVYRLIDLKNQLFEEGKDCNLFFTSNLAAEGYQTLTERYDRRFFDRLKTMCNLYQYGTNDSESHRGETRPITPNSEQLNRIITDFMLNKLGVNYEIQLHPLLQKNIEILVSSLRQYAIQLIQAEKETDWILYCSLKRNFSGRLIELRECIDAHDVAKEMYLHKYTEINDFLNGKIEKEPETWGFDPIATIERKGSGTRLREKFEAMASNKSQDEAVRFAAIEEQKRKAAQLMKKHKD